MVFVSIQTSQFGSLGKCVKTLCLAVGLSVFGLLGLFAMEGRSVDSSSELNLISSGVFSCGSTTGFSTTTLCESGGSPDRQVLFEMLNPLWNIMRSVFPCLDTKETQSVARCLAWVPQDWDVGFRNFPRRVSW